MPVITFLLTIYIPGITVFFLAVVSDKKKTLLYDEDVDRCTPVLVAAACGHEDAFHCLMEYVDLNLDLLDPEKNPIFKAFYAQREKMIILQVGCSVL